jgi:hypothetical protein
MPDWALQVWGSATASAAYIFDISPQAKSALLGAIVGSSVGGTINYWLARRATRIDTEKREADRREGRKAKAQALMVKLIRVSTFARGIYQHFEECRARRPAGPLTWEVVTPIANLPEAFRFEADEIVAVMSLKNDLVANQILDIEGLYNSVLDGVRGYQQLRKEVSALLPARLNGRIASTDISLDVALKVEPQMLDMNTVLEGLDPMSVSLWALCQRALPSLLEAMRKEFGTTMQIDFRTDYTKDPRFQHVHGN